MDGERPYAAGLRALSAAGLESEFIGIESILDSQAICIPVQDAGWVGGQHPWPELVPLIFASVQNQLPAGGFPDTLETNQGGREVPWRR